MRDGVAFVKDGGARSVCSGLAARGGAAGAEQTQAVCSETGRRRVGMRGSGKCGAGRILWVATEGEKNKIPEETYKNHCPGNQEAALCWHRPQLRGCVSLIELVALSVVHWLNKEQVR